MLELSHNKLTEIPDTIFNLINLKVLDLSDNNLQTITNRIGNLINLDNLSLNCNINTKYNWSMY